MPKKTVVIGLLGSVLDSGTRASRWEKWRPTVSICQYEDMRIDRFELIYGKRHAPVYEVVTSDIRDVSPETTVTPTIIDMDDPWDFEDVYSALHDFTRSDSFDTDKENCYIHITTGSHVAQICLYLLTESRHFPVKLLQSSPPKKRKRGMHPGTIKIIDLDLSKYDKIASRFALETNEGISFLKSGIETKKQTLQRAHRPD